MAARHSLTRSHWPVWFAFALSGAAALLYEVVWTRLLALDMGHGLAAASTVLAAFMGGLAVGSAAGGRIGQQMTRTTALRTYAMLEVGIGVFALAVPLLLDGVRPVLGALYADGNGGLAYGTVRMVASLALLGIPAAAMGATFPLASRWAGAAPASMARDAARLYTANTLGATLGALAAGFLLLPTLGLLGTTAVGVVLNLLAAATAWAVTLVVCGSTSTNTGRRLFQTIAAGAARNVKLGMITSPSGSLRLAVRVTPNRDRASIAATSQGSPAPRRLRQLPAARSRAR